MPYARTLRRAIDDDLANQIEANGKVVKARQPKPRKKEPRSYLTYRWARRNVSHHRWSI